MDEKEADLGIKCEKMLKLTQDASSFNLHDKIIFTVGIWSGYMST